MDYEIAKKLREAGFPQDTCRRHIKSYGLIYWTRKDTPDPVCPGVKELRNETEKCLPADDTWYRSLYLSTLRLFVSAQYGTGIEPEEKGHAETYIYLRKLLSKPRDEIELIRNQTQCN